MATLLDAPKPTAKLEEFVEKQLATARQRVRALDIFQTALEAVAFSLVALLLIQLVYRYVAVPRWSLWTAIGTVGVLAALHIYRELFRVSRRQINPYYAARQVENAVPDSKNSLVTYVDFEDDDRLPGSIKSAISQKAARDLRKVDLNRTFENRLIIWLAIGSGVLLLANAIVAFLPPTRTALTLQEPRDGDITVFNNQDVTFEVRVHGRIPAPTDPDAVRLRMWYNPDDPESYEDRPMHTVEGDRRQFALTVPARQVRNGFHYRVLAGKAQTDEYVVTCKIIPEFTGFEVAYEYPAYLKRAPEQASDPNLVAPYGTVATMIVTTNREVRNGHIEIEGSPRTLDGRLIEGRPDAIQFTVPMQKDARFRIWFATPEGDKNRDPALMKLTVVDPKPAFRSFDLAYDYPAYLRFKPMTAAEVREPEIEAPRGTRLVVTARATRGVKDAKLELDGQPPVIGEPVPGEPMWVRFKLPAIDRDGTARVTFTPTTDEGPSSPRSIPVRALIDQPPTVRLTGPKEDDIQLPANGTLDVKGDATDDHGVDKLTLRMKVVSGGEDRDLKPKPYRNGLSFLRKDDNSWPTQVEYKDFVKLPDLRLEKDPNWRAAPGTVIEYWLEAQDNCAVEPGPNRNPSKSKRLTVIAPVVQPKEKQQIDQQNKKLEKDQKKHEQKQDENNQGEKRDVRQEPPKGAQENPDKGNPGEPMPPQKNGDPDAANPPKKEPGAQGTPQDGMPPQGGDPDPDARTEAVKREIERAERENDPANNKPGPNTPPDAKVEPGQSRPEPKAGPMDPPPADAKQPPTDPKMDMTGEGAAGSARGSNVDKTKDEKAEPRDAGMPPPGGMGMDEPQKGQSKPTFGGAEVPPAADKPEPKDAPPMGATPPEKVSKGDARNDSKKTPDPKDPKGPKDGEPTAKGKAKPEKDVTPSETKGGSDQGGPMGDKPPSDVAGNKPQTPPAPGTERPPPKKDEVTDAGNPRGGPMKDEDVAGQRPEPKNGDGTQDKTAKGGTKGGPGTPPPSDQETKPGELSREQGELAREINSTKPEVSDQAKEDVDRLMRNPETREQTRKELDKLERNAKDELTRKKAQDLRNRGEQAAKDYDQEKPTPENVDKLAKKLNSKDEKERREAEQRAKDWQKDEQNRKDLEDQADKLAKKDPQAGERVKEAMKKGEQVRNAGEQPKMDEKDLQQMAKDLNGSDDKAKAAAKDKLDKIMQDPKTRQAAQDKLNEMANKAQGQDKQDLENAAKQAGEMAQQAANQEPGKPDPKALEQAAKKMASKDPQTQKEGKDELDKLTRDPKAAAEAQKKLDEMANNAKTPEEKDALKKAADRAGQTARNDQTPKVDPEALKDVADKMANGTDKEKQEAKDRLEKMTRDPKAAKEAQDKLREMAKNAKSDKEKQDLEKAAAEADKLAKGPKDKPAPKPEDLKDLADKMAGKDDQAKKDAENKLKEMMNDPKAREEALKQLQEMAKNAKPEDKKALEDALEKANEMAKNDAPKPDPKDLAEIAKQLDKMDPKAKEELRKKMEEAMKDPKTREEMKKKADEMANKPKTPQEQKQFDDFKNQMGGLFPDMGGKPDPADPRNKLKAAELTLEKFKKDEKIPEKLGWTQEQIDQWIKDQERAIADLRKQVNKGDWRTNPNAKSAAATGPVQVKDEHRAGNDPLSGSRSAPPSGYVDPYKKFTTDESRGTPRSAEPKR